MPNYKDPTAHFYKITKILELTSVKLEISYSPLLSHYKNPRTHFCKITKIPAHLCQITKILKLTCIKLQKSHLCQMTKTPKAHLRRKITEPSGIFENSPKVRSLTIKNFHVSQHCAKSNANDTISKTYGDRTKPSYLGGCVNKKKRRGRDKCIKGWISREWRWSASVEFIFSAFQSNERRE